MNSIPLKEAEARKTYMIFWNSYVNGDLEAFTSTLDDTFEMIGTSETEDLPFQSGWHRFFQSPNGRGSRKNRNEKPADQCPACRKT
jgi:hypothetical protein